jgi:hypothetical protein
LLATKFMNTLCFTATITTRVTEPCHAKLAFTAVAWLLWDDSVSSYTDTRCPDILRIPYSRYRAWEHIRREASSSAAVGHVFRHFAVDPQAADVQNETLPLIPHPGLPNATSILTAYFFADFSINFLPHHCLKRGHCVFQQKFCMHFLFHAHVLQIQLCRLS